MTPRASRRLVRPSADWTNTDVSGGRDDENTTTRRTTVTRTSNDRVKNQLNLGSFRVNDGTSLPSDDTGDFSSSVEYRLPRVPDTLLPESEPRSSSILVLVELSALVLLKVLCKKLECPVGGGPLAPSTSRTVGSTARPECGRLTESVLGFESMSSELDV